VAKRTGKTHENLEKHLENQVTPPPTVARTRSSGGARQARGDRSGPIGISGGDFATPSARKRTTTQPRGLPVIKPTPEPKNGTPPPQPRGAQPESPFGGQPSGELGDSASQLAAEAAAVRALDSGPLTPPPSLEDPGPTPPPEPVAAAPELPPAMAPEEMRTPPPIEAAVPPGDAAPASGEPSFVPEPASYAESVPNFSEPSHAFAEPVLAFTDAAPPLAKPAAPVDVAPALEPAPEEPTFAPGPSDDVAPVSALDAEPSGPIETVDAVDTADTSFAAQETPWPELGGHNHALRAPTPIPGAIPTDAMGGDSSGRASAQPTPEPVRHVDEAEVTGGDDLEVVDGAEHLEALPAEALADGPSAAPATAPPARPPAPPPIPAAGPRRKSGEIRPPEVPAAQVVASIVPEVPETGLPEALAQRPRRSKRAKPWFEEVFDEDYLRTLPFMSADQTLREVEFIEGSLALKPGARVLDIGCGYGRHAIELVQRGLDVTGLDLSLPLLIRAADEAQKRAMSVNFVHADMREMQFEQQFDGAYSMLTSFGYFDEEANLRVAEGIGRALKPGARFLLDIVNRDYIVADLPSRVWWEGNGCVVLEEVDFNFHTSRILTHRSIVFEDGRQLEQEISVRAYSLHEIGRLLRQAGFRVLDISGSLATRGHFFGQTSRNLLILAEKRTADT
jgi:SAM-dependent methyltransferase